MMRLVLVLLAALLICSCAPSKIETPAEQYRALVKQLLRPERDEYRFYALTDAARAALKHGGPGEAEAYARELLELAREFEADWNYGNALHQGNIVLGHVELERGNVQAAKEHLLEAGKTPGSPQLDTFGPNMSLANALLKRGEKDTVRTYLHLCRRFWVSGSITLGEWELEIAAGRRPDFGAHLEL